MKETWNPSVPSRPAFKVAYAAALVLLAGILSLVPAYLAAQEVLTNEAVVGMVKAGLPEVVIVAKIRSSQTKFNLRTDALVALKQAGVSENVMMAMLEKETPGVAGSPLASPHPMAGIPPTPAPSYPPHGAGPGFSQPSLPTPSQSWGTSPGPVYPPAVAGSPPNQPGSAYPPFSLPPGGPPSQPFGAPPEQGGQSGGFFGALTELFNALKELGDKRDTAARPSASTSPPMDLTGSMPPSSGGYPGRTMPPYGSTPLPPTEMAQTTGSPPSSVPASPSDYPQPPLSAPGQLSAGDQRGKLGLEILTITPEIAQKLGNPALKGAGVASVLSGSAAQQAGVQAGDIITHVNGQPVTSAQDVVAGVEPRMRGEATRLRIVRDGRPMDITAPADPAVASPPGLSASTPPPVMPQPPATQEPAQLARSRPASVASSVAGTYRCWSQNVGRAGKRCTSPPLVLHPDGTYQMSSERGTYSVKGDQIILSESKIRGPGRFQTANQIVFEYTYQGQQHAVTYLRQDGSAPPSAAASDSRSGSRHVPVDVKLRFSPSDGSVGWINSAALIPQGENTGPEALAVTDGKQTVSAHFRSVETGRLYTLFVSSGLDRRAVGTIDLRSATGPVSLALDAPAPERDRDRLDRPRTGPGYTPPKSGPGYTAPQAGPAYAPPQSGPGYTPPKVGPGYQPPSSASEPAPKASTEPKAAEKPCNPNIPRYAQPGCKER